jgi:hypothetical protein
VPLPKTKVQKQTRMQIYNTLTLPTLLYGGKNWTMKANDKTRITAAEMRFMRTTAKHIWSDYKRNDDIIRAQNRICNEKNPKNLRTVGFNMLIECREIGSQNC